MNARIASSLLFVLLALAGGCSPYVEGFYYSPRPGVAEVRVATTQPYQPSQTPLTSYATIIGVRRADEEKHIPLSVEVKLRFDNHGPREVFFDPHTLELTDWRLVQFLPPIVSVPEPVTIPPNRPFMLQANFPFPPGMSYDSAGMSNLQLRWTVRIGDQVVPQNVSFRRIFNDFYDPYWGPGGYWGSPWFYPTVGFGGTFILR